MSVREIVGLMPITALPQTSRHLRGVINLRGKIIPVVDLRRRFGLPEAPLTEESSIITCDVSTPAGELLVGLLTDTVCEVSALSSGSLEDLPDLGGLRAPYVTGVLKIGARVVILLNADSLVQECGLDQDLVLNLTPKP
jgi:purine-binding chemotaxis protein CheW